MNYTALLRSGVSVLESGPCQIVVSSHKTFRYLELYFSILLFILAQVDAENCSLVFADLSQCVEWEVDDETAGLEQEELFTDSNGCFSTTQLQATLQYQHYTQVCLK